MFKIAVNKGTANDVELTVLFSHRIFQLFTLLSLQDAVPVERTSIPLSPSKTLEGGGVPCVSE